MTQAFEESQGGMDRRTIDAEVKAATSAAWALGDYHRFATTLVWDLGAILVDASGVRAGDHLLDVACGTGNTALRAAAVGAAVVACDLTPDSLAVGRQEADRLGLDVEWVPADAEALPFPEDSFDVVTSSVGAMWAPDHQAVADELIRVCRPGGTIAMINFAAGGRIEDFLAVFDGFTPAPPPWATSPVLWGDPEHVRRLFGNRVDRLETRRGTYLETVPGGPAGYCAFYRETFGPVVAIYAGLAAQPERVDELDRRFLGFATRADQGVQGGDCVVAFDYLVVTARVVDPVDLRLTQS